MTFDVTTITVAQFKAQFFRGFPYLPNYNPDALYNEGDEVFYAATNLFYIAQCDGITGITPGSDNTKWLKTPDSLDNWVQDQDITNAFSEAQFAINRGLYSTDANATLAYLYLTAHFLCNDLKAAMSGLLATGAFPTASKGVGSVSESYDIPQAYKDSPILSQYTGDSYGMKFLALTLPALVGNFGSVCGSAQA